MRVLAIDTAEKQHFPADGTPVTARKKHEKTTYAGTVEYVWCGIEPAIKVKCEDSQFRDFIPSIGDVVEWEE